MLVMSVDVKENLVSKLMKFIYSYRIAIVLLKLI